MSEFTPITTQEDFDAAIGPRIKRERESVSRDFRAKIDELDQKIAAYEKQIGDLGKEIEAAAKKDQQIADLQGQVKGYETASVKTRIAHEVGIPFELAGRLSGDDEAAIRKDAEALKTLIGSPHRAPAPSAETGGVKDGKGGTSDAALRGMLSSLKGE